MGAAAAAAAFDTMVHVPFVYMPIFYAIRGFADSTQQGQGPSEVLSTAYRDYTANWVTDTQLGIAVFFPFQVRCSMATAATLASALRVHPLTPVPLRRAPLTPAPLVCPSRAPPPHLTAARRLRHPPLSRSPISCTTRGTCECLRL